MQKYQPDIVEVSEDYGSSDIDLRDYYRIVRKRWIIIASVFTVILLISIISTYITEPLYTSSSQVLIERNRGKSGLESTYYYYEPNFLDTQAAIITSENVARKVVDNLKIVSRYRHHFLGKKDGNVSIVGSLKKWVKGFVKPVMSFLQSPEQGSDISGQDVPLTYAPKTDDQIITEMIQAGLRVTPIKNTKIVEISYVNKDPGIAKLVADAVVQAYMDEMLDIKLSTSSYSLKWMTAKAAEERDKLEKSERELQQFMRDNDLVTVENRLTILPQKLSEFSSQLSKAEAKKKELQDLLEQINATKNNSESLEKLPVFASEDVLKAIRARIYKVNQNIQELSKKYGAKHPVMIRAKDELRIIKEEKRFEINRIVSTIRNSYELAVSKQRSLQELLSKTKAETLNLNEKFMQYSIMKREVDSNRVLYDTLQAGIKQQGVTKQSQSVNIWVIKKATLPEAPSVPNKKKNLLLGIILGLFSGVGLALLIEYLDNTISTVQEIQENYGLTVLGAIEELQSKEESIDSYVLSRPLSPMAESYRLIRSALLLSSAAHPPKITLITSMNKSEGKTVTATNLARMLTQGGKKVLIIDCDLRRPRMHSLLRVRNNVGLSSYLAGEAERCSVVNIAKENISLIPSGPVPPDPAELRGSPRMEKLLEYMSSEYDFIVLDSPPIASVTDSLTLSQYVDGIILVVKAGGTTKETFESGLKILHDIHARIIGVVLNGVKTYGHGAYQYGYSKYYAKDDD